MSHSASDQRLNDLLEKLQQKYAAMGQDMPSYLDGLLYADYLTYWDYIHLDTLLSLQNPKTSFPDEKVFIIYHQITELYFNLVLSELEQICHHPQLTDSFFVARLDRVIRYFQHLEDSFEIMIVGMEREQFLKFRMSLLPASGFQSGQYRMIEFCSTDVINLVNIHDRPGLTEYSDIDQQLEKVYWRSGATELATGAKTLTLKQFEKKYMGQFRELALRYRDCNLLSLYQRKFAGHEAIKQRLREFDLLANVYWPLAHLKSAGHYLQRDPEDIKATGGTNWQKYLPPRFQKIMFFPELWTEQEKEEWGKPGVLKNLKLTS